MSIFSTRGAVAPTATVPTTVRPKTEGASMSTTTKQKTLIAASAAAISAIGLLTVPAPAQADPGYPACDNYQFRPPIHVFQNKFLTIYQDNDIIVTLNATGQQISGGARYRTAANYERPTDGHADGGITGRTIIFNVNWDRGPGVGFTNLYNGQVNDDGGAGGTTTNNLGTTNGWSAGAGSFTCVE